MDADLGHHLRVVLATRQRPQELRREPRPSGKFRHPLQAAHGGGGHDPGDDRHANPRQFAPVAEVVEVAVLKEKLRDDIVGPCVHLRLEILDLQQAVGRGGVAFGETGHADSEAAPVGMRAGIVELADGTDQVGRVLEIVVLAAVAGRARGVAAEGENVADPLGGVAFQNGRDFRLFVADAGEMGNRVERGLRLHAHDQFMGQFPRGAARAVGDAHEMRQVGLQLQDRLKKTFRRFRRLRREELEGKRGRVGGKNVLDVHARKAEAMQAPQHGLYSILQRSFNRFGFERARTVAHKVFTMSDDLEKKCTFSPAKGKSGRVPIGQIDFASPSSVLS